MEYMSVKEAAEKWGLKERRVRVLCQEGRIPNLMRTGHSWLIPANTDKPVSKRTKENKNSSERFELLLNPVFCEDPNCTSYSDEEKMLCQANDLYFRGEFDQAEALFKKVIDNSLDDGYLLIAYAGLRYMYMDTKSDMSYAKSSLAQMKKIADNNEDFIYIRQYLSLDCGDVPSQLNFSSIPKKFIPFFAYFSIYTSSTNGLFKKGDSFAIFAIIQSELLCNLISEKEQPGLLLCIHITLCMYYNFISNKESYDYHASRALAIALPRKWLVPFAEFSYSLPWLEIKAADEDAYKRFCELSEFVIGNYIKSGFFKSTIPALKDANPDEIKIAFMLSNNMSNAQIAEIMGLSLYRVKAHIKNIYAHTGVYNRQQLAELVHYHFH